MGNMEQSRRNGRAGRYGACGAALVLFLSVFAAFSPRPATAQIFCEWPIVPPIVTGLLIIGNNIAIDASLSPPDSPFAEGILHIPTRMVMSYLAGNIGIGGAVHLGAGADAAIAIPGLAGFNDVLSEANIPILGDALDIVGHSKFYGGLGFMDDLMRIRLDKFWNDMWGALAGMMREVYGAGINNVRLVASIEDGNNMSENALKLQQAEIKAKKEHVVTTQSCQFDTTARSLGPARMLATATKVAMSGEVNDIGNNVKGSEGGSGPAGFFNSRFQIYLQKFCDVNANGGKSPCTAMRTPKPEPGMSLIKPALAQAAPVPLPDANAATSPGKTIFGQDTYPVSGEMLEAIKQLVLNITGYVPPPPVPRAALDTDQGIELAAYNREVATVFNFLGDMVMDPIGDRMPSADAADPSLARNIQDIGNRVGRPDASATPSEREILRSVIDMLTDPSYYTDLGDVKSTIAQKEIYLKAYNNMLLYKLIEKQEKLAAAYAIQTADILNERKENTALQNLVPAQ